MMSVVGEARAVEAIKADNLVGIPHPSSISEEIAQVHISERAISDCGAMSSGEFAERFSPPNGVVHGAISRLSAINDAECSCVDGGDGAGLRSVYGLNCSSSALKVSEASFCACPFPRGL